MPGRTHPQHPAKFSKPILEEIADALKSVLPPPKNGPKPRVLDPFAGVGGIHRLQREGYETVGVEIEPEWAWAHPDTLVGDALKLVELFAGQPPFDVIVTSVTYGNRMADHHEAKDDSVRNTYRHKLGRPLSPTNSGGMQWGPHYKAFHIAVYQSFPKILLDGGWFLLNVSNHIRKFEEVDVTGWHIEILEHLGFVQKQRREIETRRQKFGANANLRVAHEDLILFQWGGV